MILADSTGWIWEHDHSETKRLLTDPTFIATYRKYFCSGRWTNILLRFSVLSNVLRQGTHVYSKVSFCFQYLFTCNVFFLVYKKASWDCMIFFSSINTLYANTIRIFLFWSSKIIKKIKQFQVFYTN